MNTQIKILYQPLKAKWYRMIESGIKTEEYREGFYWTKRLCRSKGDCDWGGYCAVSHCTKKGVPTDYTHVQFSLGYPKKDDESRRMTFELKGIVYREGREEWGAEKGKKYLVEVLGRRTTLDGTKILEVND